MADQLSTDALNRKALACFDRLNRGFAKSLFLPTEDPAQFLALLQNAFAQEQPATDEHAGIVTDCVIARWYLSRCQRAYFENEDRLLAEYPDATTWTPAQVSRLQLLDQDLTKAEHCLQRAVAAVKSIRSESRGQTENRLAAALRLQNDERSALGEELPDEIDLLDCGMFAPGGIPLSDVNGDEEPNSVPSIDQYIDISLKKDGTAQIELFKPDNDDVLRAIANAHRLPDLPVQVMRHFFFINGIPSDLQWLVPIDSEFNQPNLILQCALSFEVFQKLAAAEGVSGSKLPLNHLPFILEGII